MSGEMTMNDWLFFGELVKDWDATKALRRSGIYKGEYVYPEASRRFNKPCVQAEVAKYKESIIGKIQLNAELVSKDILNVLAADPRELYEVVTLACRYCWGEGHKYQRTPNEWRLDETESTFTGKPFHPMGGIGWNPYKGPHENCPECHGQGIIEERIKDVRFLSPAAAALYIGGERTKHGLKINMRSKDAARKDAALYLGLNKETVALVDGKQLKDMTDEELLKLAQGEKL
jgi:hypothetical protein